MSAETNEFMVKTKLVSRPLFSSCLLEIISDILYLGRTHSTAKAWTRSTWGFKSTFDEKVGGIPDRDHWPALLLTLTLEIGEFGDLADFITGCQT